MTEYESYRMIFDLVQVVVIIGLTIYTWLSNKNKANQSAINRVDQRVSDLTSRTNSLETRVDHLPSDQHIKEIHVKINAVAKEQSNTSGQLELINRQLSMINQHLLKGPE